MLDQYFEGNPCVICYVQSDVLRRITVHPPALDVAEESHLVIPLCLEHAQTPEKTIIEAITMLQEEQRHGTAPGPMVEA